MQIEVEIYSHRILAKIITDQNLSLTLNVDFGLCLLRRGLMESRPKWL